MSMMIASSRRSIARAIGNKARVQSLVAKPRVNTYSVTPTLSLPAVPDEGNAANFPDPAFWIPREKREGRSVFVADNTMWFGQNRLKRNDRNCPSRDLNFTAKDWANHKSPYRRIRHIINLFKSSTIQRLAFPELASTASIAIGLAYYNEVIAGAGQMITIPSAAFAGATTAIGILAGFRLNASYGRYEECRIFWGDINNTIRDLARQTMMWMKDENQKQRMLKLCKAWGVVLNFHLNAKGGHHNILRKPGQLPTFEDRVHSEFLAELRDIYRDGVTDEDDYQRMAKVKYTGGNTPIEVLTLMGETIQASVGTVDAIYVRELDEQCQRLCAAFGASERVLRTSLPTSFTRHTSRLMFFWSNALPFALYPTLGPFGTMPAAVFTSWAIQSIEDIGVQLEEPFNVLPLRQYSDGMFDVIGQIERNFTPYSPVKEAKVEYIEEEPAVLEMNDGNAALLTFEGEQEIFKKTVAVTNGLILSYQAEEERAPLVSATPVEEKKRVPVTNGMNGHAEYQMVA